MGVTNIDFSTILDEEMGLDSLERTWRSFRRGYIFMPMDSAVAIKLAKIQDAKVKRTFAIIQEFSKKNYPNIHILPIDTLKNDLAKLQTLEKPIEEALCAYSVVSTRHRTSELQKFTPLLVTRSSTNSTSQPTSNNAETTRCQRTKLERRSQ